MSAIIVGLILLSRVFLMMLKVFWIVLWPILLIACIVFVCINFYAEKEVIGYRREQWNYLSLMKTILILVI